MFMNCMEDLEQLHSKLREHLKEQNEKWEHFVYSKKDGFYQGLEEIKIRGSRSSEKRFEEYNIEKYLSKEKKALDIGSNCGFFSIFVSKFVGNILGVEINRYLIAIANDTKNYLGLENAKFTNSSFEEFKTDERFDLIFSLANDSTIDDNTKFNFSEYIQKILDLLNDGGIVIFESQAIDTMVSEKFEEKFRFLDGKFEVLEKRKIVSEYPVNVPYRDFVVLKKLDIA